MSMYNDIAWQEKETKKNVNTIHRQSELCSQIPRGHWPFLGPGSEEKWDGTYIDKLDGSWDQTAGNMMANSSESGHPIFRASSALEGRELHSKGGCKKSTHFIGSHENIELLLGRVISANQLSVYGAAADLRNKLPGDLGLQRNLPHLIIWKRWRFLLIFLLRKILQCTEAGKRGAKYMRKIEHLSDDQKLSKICPEAGLKLVERGHYFYTLGTEEDAILVPRIHDASKRDEDSCERMDSHKNTRIGPVLNIQVCHHEDQYTIEVPFKSLSQDRTASWVRIVIVLISM